MKYSIVTFGCRVNQADSFEIEEQLRRQGAVSVPPDSADVVVVNTCSVTATADQGARQAVRRIVRSNPTAKVVVTGCYATRRPRELQELSNVVQVIGNASKASLVESLLAEQSTADRFASGDGPCGLTLEPGVAGRTALILRVQTGCDETCSYCIIPTTRGAGRSRSLDAVLRNIRHATAAGYREIVITGVHLGSYGRDLRDGTTLTGLVQCLSDWPEDVLFRIGSLEPMDCTHAIIDAATRSPRIAPHFHLPLQHGSNGMLRAMRRPYTAGYYHGLAHHLRQRIPHASIGTDIIVGFPGEDEDTFGEMQEFLQTLPVTYLHVFPYSDRPGTDASEYAAKVDGAVIRARGREVRALGETKALEFRRSQHGRVMRALVVDDGSAVVTDNYLKVKLSEPQIRNSWVEVRIDRTEPLVGALVHQQRDLLCS